ncbi:serine/threonine-protein kinase [Tessaracoccus massiliensis]|uniref:serine/threonine-protein kinase n=1 Tax=Tessaracoccus massiliensis TaxID=1522311 RepID=UPI0015D61C55|nr:serine/threonine-protein kinase [Tessaracoccus massiliensis]
MEMIGRYRITGRIGSGSFATVYRGHDDTLDVPVAVKVLADNWATNDDVRARFLAEARLLRRLSDERVVRVYDIGTTDRGQPYFVMDLANGGSLEQLRKRMVAPGLALRLCAEAARALEVLHRNQLVHRDITPGNILLSNTPTGVRVMLADLGVAKSLLDEYRDTMTAGTPAYMALEQANSTQLDQRSDIYSLACVAYALLTGRPPFPVKTLAELLSRNHNIGPAAIAEQVGAPELLDQVMASALSPDPNRRPQTAAQFAEVLDRLADQLPGGESYQPRPITSTTAGTPSVGQLPTAPQPIGVLISGGRQSAGSLSARSETPVSMLDNYIGRGRYAPKKSTETHSPWFYVWVTGSAILLLGLTIWLTIYVLTR